MTDILFFCSPIGLGHATRDVAISNYLENFSIKFVTGSGAAKLFSKYNLDVLDAYTPPNFIVQDGSLKNPLKWLWGYYKYYKECKKISKQIIEKENPKVVVSDEDFASLTVSQEKKIPSILVTDILETNFTHGFGSIIEKKMNRSMKEIIEKCNAVILPENGSDQNNIKRVGPIVRKTNHTRDELRKKFEFTKITVVISVGGTDAGEFLIKKALEATTKLDVDVVVVSGPALEEKYQNIRNLGFVKNLHELIYAADIIVSLAGKSTIDESNAYGTPGIFIPIKDHFEQEDNAKEEGFSYEDVFRLESLISEKLTQKRNQVDADGASNASRIISDLISQVQTNN